MRARTRWKDHAAHAELLRLYAEVDALLAPFSCDDSTECCQFGVTGREPYPTAVELAEVKSAMAGQGIGAAPPSATKRRLPIADPAKRCPLLSSEGRCRVYASRPFGCRTFFCDRAQGPGKLPRGEIQRLSRAIADLSARAFPENPLPRALTRALADPFSAR